MKGKQTAQQSPTCMACGHILGRAAVAGMTARDGRDDLCVIKCGACGAYNEVRSEPQSGFEAQPVLVVRRTFDHPPPHAAVFDETVEPGIDPPPETKGRTG
jgi:hypothetical protein